MTTKTTTTTTTVVQQQEGVFVGRSDTHKLVKNQMFRNSLNEVKRQDYGKKRSPNQKVNLTIWIHVAQMSLKIHFLFKESFGFLSFGLGKDW